MTNKFIIIVSVFLLSICSFGQKDQLKTENSFVDIRVDSVFINQYEEPLFDEPIYIYYYFLIRNNTDDTLKIDLPLTYFENQGNNNQIYGVYNNDTINFYSGSKSKIMPKETKSITLRYGDGDDVEQIFYKLKKKKFKTCSTFFYDLILQSELNFQFNNCIYKVNLDSVTVIYRDPNDKGEHMWPL